MKAAIVEKPGSLVVKDIPMPKVGEYDVLCELLFGATCTGTDSHIINGTIPFPIKYPTVLGHESIGRVVETGSKVKYFNQGDLVTRVGVPASPQGDYFSNWGGFAEYGIARDHWAMYRDGIERKEWNAYRVNQTLPASIDPAEGTMIITWRETLSYLTRMGVGEGHNLLVIGSGGNGLAFAAHGVNRGAERVAMIGAGYRKGAAGAIGVTDYFDYKTENMGGLIREQYPQGFDYIIDAVGKKDGLDSVMPLLKDGGAVGIYGLDDAGKCVIHPNRVRGRFTFYNNGYDEEETHEAVVNYIKKGLLKAEIWMDLQHPFLLKDIKSAFDIVSNRERIKALVKLSN